MARPWSSRPTGNAGVAYRVFAHSISINPDKTVEMVVLPSNGKIHLFDMAIGP